ncbi:hypothetical protein [Corynebacterium stationis]|uniref:hypothetical protein n=1 Tax=Corynebacterium stationis TaxID=1705 RepID=UPI000A5FF32D|nr:hypothetical protein [Corynebacterium stationis]
MPLATPPSEAEMRSVLSGPRFNTYFEACDGDPLRAGQLYSWNASLSAALLVPAHFAEVSTRNAAANILEATYGSRWPWSDSFANSLPSPAKYYSPKRDLQVVRKQCSTTGKVIAELKLAFWSSLFTSRHDERLWKKGIATAFPHSPYGDEKELRHEVRNKIENIRLLRNRIAHHEPVFTRNLRKDLQGMKELIEFRSPEAKAWVESLEEVSLLLDRRP